MHSPTTPPAGLSRRGFLRVGLWSTLGLATVSTTALLSGCSSATTASGFQFLREQDVNLFRALLPVVLKGALPEGQAVDDTLHSLDGLLFYSSEAGHKQLRQLFDMLTFAPTRFLLAGVSHDWTNVDAEGVEAFLQRWRHSSVGMFRGAHKALLQMSEMSWYLLPQSWAAIGYAPPVKVI